SWRFTCGAAGTARSKSNGKRMATPTGKIKRGHRLRLQMYTSSVMIHTALIFLLVVFSAAAQQPAQESTARIEGIVVRADTGDPLPAATVVLSKDGAGRLDTKYGTTTRADGHFTVKDLPKGRYRLLATTRGFEDQEYGQKRPNGSGTVLDVTNETLLRDI